MNKLIIFDCDGVLIDSEILACTVETEYMNDLGYTITLDEYMDRYMGKSFAECINDLISAGIKFDQEEFTNKSKNKIYTPEFMDKLNALDGIHTLLDNVSNPFCIASGSSMERLRHTLKITNLLDYFDGKIFSAELVQNSKPAPDIFLYAAEKMGYTPDNCIVIEDSINGVKAGIAAGMTTYGFVGASHMDNARANGLVEVGAQKLFYSMGELAKFLKG